VKEDLGVQGSFKGSITGKPVELLRNSSRENCFVLLSKPCHPENIGLVARGMKNTGFKNLRLVLDGSLPNQAYKTAVHSEEILKRALIYPHLSEAVKDLDVVLAAAARHRKAFSSINFKEAVEKATGYPIGTKIGLLFGNERTGLVSEELRYSNYRFSIPQKQDQPSYNLAFAVLLTLFQIYFSEQDQGKQERESLLISRKEQEECIQMIVKKLEDKNFIHDSNRAHIMNRVHDLFGRLEMDQRDKKLLLAVFSKGADERKKP